MSVIEEKRLWINVPGLAIKEKRTCIEKQIYLSVEGGPCGGNGVGGRRIIQSSPNRSKLKRSFCFRIRFRLFSFSVHACPHCGEKHTILVKEQNQAETG